MVYIYRNQLTRNGATSFGGQLCIKLGCWSIYDGKFKQKKLGTKKNWPLIGSGSKNNFL